MKRIIIALALIPNLIFGQGCDYTANIQDASTLCHSLQVRNNFISNESADIALEKILSVVPTLAKRFVMLPCDGIRNCYATQYNGIRYIIYDAEFMSEIATDTDNNFSKLSILAHEIGHHINGHALDVSLYRNNIVDVPTLSESRQMELEADEFSGYVLAKLGATLKEATMTIEEIGFTGDDTYSTHPSKEKRLEAIAKGFLMASSSKYEIDELSIQDYYTVGYSHFTEAIAEENPAKHQKAIDVYSYTIDLLPNEYWGYLYRGFVYYRMDEYELAIKDYTKIIEEIDDCDWDTYKKRAQAYVKLGSIDLAIKDYLKATLHDNWDSKNLSEVTAYDVYGELAKLYSLQGKDDKALEYYSKEITLTYKNAKTRNYYIDITDLCDMYQKRGKIYYKNGNLNLALEDYTNAILWEPDELGLLYSERAEIYKLLNKDLLSIADHKNACILDPDNAKSTSFFAIALEKEVSDPYFALSLYSKAILLDSDNAEAYYKRGNLCKKLNLYYCDDFQKSCSLGYKRSCAKYNKCK